MHRYSIAILLQAVCPILGIDPEEMLEKTDWTSAERPGADQTVSGRRFRRDVQGDLCILRAIRPRFSSALTWPMARSIRYSLHSRLRPTHAKA